MEEAMPLHISHIQNQILDDLLDPVSLLPLQSSDSESHCLTLGRGPRYRAYSELRDSKLRSKQLGQHREQEPQPEDHQDSKLTPMKKQARFQLGSGNSRKGPSILAQSVPDFSSALRKENRKPPTRAFELTPPSKTWSRTNTVAVNSRGSKSASAGEKNGKGLMARKSYANLDELKGLASAARNAINSGSGTVTGQRKFLI